MASNIIAVLSAKISQLTGLRSIKFKRLGRFDTQDTYQLTPFGIDSAPIPDMRGVYLDTDSNGKPAIIGYVNLNQVSQPGEMRLFSMDSVTKELKTHIYLKNDGVIELGGNDDNLVQFAKMALAFQETQDSVNDLKTLINSWVVASGDGGAALKAVLATWVTQTLVQDIQQAKIDSIKTP